MYLINFYWLLQSYKLFCVSLINRGFMWRLTPIYSVNRPITVVWHMCAIAWKRFVKLLKEVIYCASSWCVCTMWLWHSNSPTFLKTNIGKTRIFFKQRDATKREIAVMFVVILFESNWGEQYFSDTRSGFLLFLHIPRDQPVGKIKHRTTARWKARDVIVTLNWHNHAMSHHSVFSRLREPSFK